MLSLYMALGPRHGEAANGHLSAGSSLWTAFVAMLTTSLVCYVCLERRPGQLTGDSGRLLAQRVMGVPSTRSPAYDYSKLPPATTHASSTSSEAPIAPSALMHEVSSLEMSEMEQ